MDAEELKRRVTRRKKKKQRLSQVLPSQRQANWSNLVGINLVGSHMNVLTSKAQFRGA
jgi:hypothetical protein